VAEELVDDALQLAWSGGQIERNQLEKYCEVNAREYHHAAQPPES
jgi:hypothetical protein